MSPLGEANTTFLYNLRSLGLIPSPLNPGLQLYTYILPRSGHHHLLNPLNLLNLSEPGPRSGPFSPCFFLSVSVK